MNASTKHLTVTTLMATCVSLFAWFMASCNVIDMNDDDIIWDFWPVSLKIEVLDPAGNIIDQNSDQWAKLLEHLSVEYDGQTYAPRDITGILFGNGSYDVEPQSRDILVIFYGLYYSNDVNGGSLYFGEFPTDDDYNLEFKVNWPDGTSSKVKYEHKFKMMLNDPKISGKLWVDGKKQQNSNTISHRIE